MEKKIVLILGHPSETSFCNALLKAYQKGAEATGAICKTIVISQLRFDSNLSEGYKTSEAKPLEADLMAAQTLMAWADHVVMAYPNWWGFMPAIAKGFIDRVFLPGFAFKHRSGNNFPEKLLKGKSMRLLVTMDTPKWWFYLIYRASQYQILKRIVFGYMGFDPIRFSTFGFIRKSTEGVRTTWLRKVEYLGRQMN